MWALLRLPRFRRAAHANGYDNRIDIAKSVFQVHGVDAAGEVVIRHQLKRRTVLSFFQKLPPCLVGIEASRIFTQLEPFETSQLTAQMAHRPQNAGVALNRRHLLRSVFATTI
jgi:hypothetical protein